MADFDEGIVQQYAQHLLAKARAVSRTWTVTGAVAGLFLGAVPLFRHPSIVSGGARYFALLLGAAAGAFAGRAFGENRALDLRFESQLKLRQLEIESRLVAPPAPVARQAQPPAQAPAQVAPA